MTDAMLERRRENNGSVVKSIHHGAAAFEFEQEIVVDLLKNQLL